MIAVLDTSAAAEIVLHQAKAQRFDAVCESSDMVIAPDLFFVEIANVFWKYHRANIFAHEECVQYVEDGVSLVDVFHCAQDLWKEALGESLRNNHPVYDMLYAVLTRRNDATLVTNDRVLADICGRLNIACLF